MNTIHSNRLMSLGTLFIIFASMTHTIQVFGVSVPFYDEWNAEALAMYVPLNNNAYSFWNLFDPHNGHRIFFTRATELILYKLNGAWDPELQLLVNAFLHALTGALFVYFISQGKNKTERIVVSLALILLFSIPFSWMSILVPFQTQFYYMVFFSVLSIFLLCRKRYISGYVVSIFAFYSMTPGAFVLLAFCGVKIIECINSRAKPLHKESFIHIAISFGIFLLLVGLRGGDTATSQYSAQTIYDFLVSLVAAFWWPYNASELLGGLVHIPLIIMSIRALTGYKFSKVALVLGWFVLLQLIAMAYLRGGGGVPPANRYWELLLLGIVANGLCIGEFIGSRHLSIRHVFIGIWLCVIINGLFNIGAASLTFGLPTRMEQNQLALTLIREYLNTKDQAVFEGHQGLEISYPDKEILVQLLDNPEIQNVLPSSITQNGKNRMKEIKELAISNSLFYLLTGFMLYAFAGYHLFQFAKRKF